MIFLNSHCIIFFQWDSINSCCFCRWVTLVKVLFSLTWRWVHFLQTHFHSVSETIRLHLQSKYTHLTQQLKSVLTWHCYERIKAEKDWSFNQFTKYTSEYSAYWLKLVSVSSSDLTQFLFSFSNIFLFNIIFLSTSYSTHVTNTFSSSLTQSLNIT